MSSSPLIENYPGYMHISGTELSNNLYEQVTNLGGEIELEEVINIKDGDIKEVITDSNTYKTKVIIIATGAKYRRLGLENEENLIGNGIHFCVACDGAFYKDKVVAVVGGGNTAIINAITLSDICKKVYIIQNLHSLTCEIALNSKLNNKKNVEIYCDAVVKKIVGEDELESVIIETSTGDIELKPDGMFVSIGLVAQNNIFKDIINLNEYEYIDSNEECKTNIDGIFVAGDCRSKKVRQITTAVSDGTMAALQAIRYLDK